MEKQPSRLDVMRHSAAHVMAKAIQSFYPEAKFGIGPVIADGFYYDIDLQKTLKEEDLLRIEDKMREIIQADESFLRKEMSLSDAMVFFEKKGQPYKVELLRDLKTRGTTQPKEDIQGEVDIQAGEKVSLYETGDFVDLCRGPHVDSTKQIGAFKLHRVAGAYWRGNEKNKMLQRIYGLCFETEEELDAYEALLEEAKKRDHRMLGVALDLFTFSDLVGSGLPLWTPRGTLVRQLLDDVVWNLRKSRGYERVEIPHITKKDLYIKSGHWDKFKDELFKFTTREGHEFALKPMNCPHHTQIYAHLSRSYRDLPQRYADTTMVYRDEQSGELFGLSRVRVITQDDAHVFCRNIQVKEEILKIWDIIDEFYSLFCFKNLEVTLSLHDPAHFEKCLGSREDWKYAEEQLRALAQTRGRAVKERLGEAAFYGPKIDFIATDALGRAWQVATIQLDMNMPERFDLFCVNEKGEKERIVMIHAAIMGSIERFLSVLIEHLAGAFPLWLAPVQVVFISCGAAHVTYCHTTARAFREHGFRVEVYDENETVGRKIRNAEQMKVPYMIVIGDRELALEQLSVRIRGEKEVVKIEQAELLRVLAEKMEKRSMDLKIENSL